MNADRSPAPGLRCDADASPVSQRALVALLLLVALAAVLRFWGLGREGLWYDELVMAHLTSGPWRDVLAEAVGARPPAYVMLSWLWTHVFGTSDAGLRSLSATLGVANVAMMFVVGRQLFNTRTALIAAALMMASPLQLYHSQEHRYYALVVLAGLLCLYTLVRGLRTGRTRWFVAFTAAGLLLHFAHYLSALVFVAMAVGVLLGRRRWPHRISRAFWIAVPLTLVVASAPMLNQLLGAFHRTAAAAEGATEQVMWIDSPPVWAPIRTVANFLFRGARYLQPIGVAAGLAVLAVGSVTAWREAGGFAWRPTVARWAVLARDCRGEVVLLLATLVLPMIGALAVSWLLEPMYVDRYLIAASPALYLLLAAAAAACRPIVPPAATTAAILAVMFGAVWTYYTEPGRGDWRGVAAFLEGRLQPGDAVLYSSERGDIYETQNVGLALGWYLDAPPRDGELNVAQPPAALQQAVAEKLSPTGRTWLVVWDDPGRDRRVEQHLGAAPRSAFRLADRYAFQGLTVYDLRAADAEESHASD